MSREAKSLVKRMLTRDPKQRSSAEELLQHEFFTDKINRSFIDNDTLLDIQTNLDLFRKNSLF